MGWGLAVLIVVFSDIERVALYDAERFHWPLWDGLPTPSGSAYYAVLGMAGIGASLTLVGLLTRASAFLATICQTYVFASDLLQFRNHVYLICLLGLLLCLSPSDRVVSLDAYLRKRRHPGEPVVHEGSLTAAQVIKVQIVIVYAWAVLNKLRGSFLDGWVLGNELNDAFPRSLAGALLPSYRDALASIFSSPAIMGPLSYLVIFVEMFVVVGLLYRPLRRSAVWAGVLLHLGIALTMNVFAFGLLMVASYPLFLAAEPYSDAAAAGMSKSMSNNRTPDPTPEPP